MTQPEVEQGEMILYCEAAEKLIHNNKQPAIYCSLSESILASNILILVVPVIYLDYKEVHICFKNCLD